MTPVEVFRETPVGSDPATDHVYGVRPPDAESVNEYAVPDVVVSPLAGVVTASAPEVVTFRVSVVSIGAHSYIAAVAPVSLWSSHRVPGFP